MLCVLNVVSDIIADPNIEIRIRELLLRRHIYRGVKDITVASLDQRLRGIDLVVHFDNQLIYLQLQPNYTLANLAKRFTMANVAIIVADKKTPEGLLQKKLCEGLDYFRH